MPWMKMCCPVADVFGQSYHWSLMQVEYATDLVFRSTATLSPLYQHLVRQSALDVKADQVASSSAEKSRRNWRRRSVRGSPPGSLLCGIGVAWPRSRSGPSSPLI
jgi:hypothetical protein